MNRDQLRAAGEALYGVRWQTALAREIGVADRTVRRWLAGNLPIGERAVRGINHLLALRGHHPLGEPVLQHVTMTTGNVVQSPRSGVQQGTLELLRPLLAAGRGVAAGIPFEVVRRQPGSALLTIGAPPAVLCGVCWDQERSADGWAAMLAASHEAGMRSLPAELPAVPWLAVVILPSGAALMSLETIMMLGDMERCLAWTLIEAPSRDLTAAGDRAALA